MRDAQIVEASDQSSAAEKQGCESYASPRSSTALMYIDFTVHPTCLFQVSGAPGATAERGCVKVLASCRKKLGWRARELQRIVSFGKLLKGRREGDGLVKGILDAPQQISAHMYVGVA